jgi:hypothetical protein
MTLTSEKIETSLRNSFSKTYKAFGDFVDSGEIWELCISAVHDTTLMNHIIFCNDIHNIPPTNTFLKAKGAAKMRDLTELEKRSIGAFWGFVFKYVFGYRNQKSVAARVNTVKTATYFFDVAEKFEIAGVRHG